MIPPPRTREELDGRLAAFLSGMRLGERYPKEQFCATFSNERGETVAYLKTRLGYVRQKLARLVLGWHYAE